MDVKEGVANIVGRAIDLYVEGRYYLGRTASYLGDLLQPGWAAEFMCDSEDEDTDDEDEKKVGARLTYSELHPDKRYVTYKIRRADEEQPVSYIMLAGGTFDYSAETRTRSSYPLIENIKVFPNGAPTPEQGDILTQLAGYTGDFHGAGIPTLAELCELWPEAFGQDITKIIVNMDNMEEYLIK